MNTRPFVDIRTSSTFLSIALCTLLGLAIACGGSAEATEPPQPTPVASDEASDPTAEPIATNILIPAATSDPPDTSSLETPFPDSTPSAPPTTREWNILGPLDASVTIADFGDFQ